METAGGKAKIDTSSGRKQAEHTFLSYRKGDDVTKVSIAGHVLGIDGRPAEAGHRVTAAPQAWSSQSGRVPSTVTDRHGTFVLRDLPDGLCDVSVTPDPLTQQSNVRIEDVTLKKGEPTYVRLSFQQK